VKEEDRITDENLAHYEGDHLVFQPKNVTKEQVFSAYKNINKEFYSWRNIIRRWWRFITIANFKGNIFRRLFRGVFLSTMMMKISVFQRHHAQMKVYEMQSNQGSY
ncbi:MAG TPA: hypothetical protein VEP89_02815, partial [Draconibacterium sp.]|nr:hypothetical protein [Draconibacterium sp.]